MAGHKISVEFEINPDMKEMLEAAVEKHGLRDLSKALRCVLDYVAAEGDQDHIFGTIRCRRC